MNLILNIKEENKQKEQIKTIQPSTNLEQPIRRKEIFIGSQDLSSLFSTPRAIPSESPLLSKLNSTSLK